MFNVVIALCLVAPCAAQTLGDLARREQLRKQQNAATQRHVYTNEDFALQRADTSEIDAPQPAEPSSSAGTAKRDAALRATIVEKKKAVRDLERTAAAIQKRLDAHDNPGVKPSDSVQAQNIGGMNSPGPGVCVTSAAMGYDPYKEWCEEPARLQAQLETVQAQTKKARSELEALQEKARKLGYGNAFYDPE